MTHRHTLLLTGLLASLLIGVSLVLARGYTTVEKLNFTINGEPFNGVVQNLNLSANGQHLVFEAYGHGETSTFDGLYYYNLISKQQEYIGQGYWAGVSNDGRYITHQGREYIDGNEKDYVTLYDREDNMAIPLDIGLNGEPLNGDTYGVLSPNGRYFVYYTGSTNTFDGITETCQFADLEPFTCNAVFLWDRVNNTQERISLNDNEENANGDSGIVSISDDGRFILFASNSTNLTAQTLPCLDQYNCYHFFVRDRATGTTELVNLDPDGNILTDVIVHWTLHNIDISGDGRYVVFTSDTNSTPDVTDTNVYVRDIQNNTTEIINVDSNGIRIPNSKNAGFNVISYDGRFVLFIAGDGLLYVRDRSSGSTVIASKDAKGVTGTMSTDIYPGPLLDWSPASISANGDTVVFESASDTLVETASVDTWEKIFVSQGEAIPTMPTPTLDTTATSQSTATYTETPIATTPEPTITAQATQSETATPQATLAQTETPASTATASPSTPTPEPTCELILNGGFEIAGDTAKLAANWNGKGLLKDKRVQNKPDKVVAHSGDFAFQFKGNDSGKITQNVASTGDCGNTLTLSAWVEGKNLIGARVQAKVIYTNEPPVKLRLTANELNGTYAYKPVSASLTLTDTVQQIKVQIGMKNGRGRLRIDDISLSTSSVSTLITLPITQ